MNEKDLNIEYICDKTLLDKDDELVPIILSLIQESYKAGLCQTEFDNTMNLIEENQELKQKYENAVADYETTMAEKNELKKQNNNFKTSLDESQEVIVDYIKENQKLKKQLKKRKYYKFYKYENNSNGSNYCFCERSCDSNMSLNCFLENGEICGFMSESLVDNHDNIEEISLNEFAHDFIKPLINANFQNKNQQKEFIEYLEDLIKQNETVVEVSKYGLPKNCSKLLINFYKEIFSKYQEIIGGNKDEK